MVTEALRAVMLQADGAGRLEGDGVVSGSAEHPVCGDLVEVDVLLQGDVVAELRWRAQACPASTAVCAAARTALRGRRVAECAGALGARIEQLGGLAAHERHAQRLFLDALGVALGRGPR